MRLFFLLVSFLSVCIGITSGINLKDAEEIAQEMNEKLTEYFKNNDLEKLSELFIPQANLHVDNKEIAAGSRDDIKKYYEAERESGVKVLKYLSKNVELDGDKITVTGRLGLRQFYADSGPWDLGNYTKVIVQDPSDNIYRIAEEVNTFYKNLKN